MDNTVRRPNRSVSTAFGSSAALGSGSPSGSTRRWPPGTEAAGAGAATAGAGAGPAGRKGAGGGGAGGGGGGRPAGPGAAGARCGARAGGAFRVGPQCQPPSPAARGTSRAPKKRVAFSNPPAYGVLGLRPQR